MVGEANHQTQKEKTKCAFPQQQLFADYRSDLHKQWRQSCSYFCAISPRYVKNHCHSIVNDAAFPFLIPFHWVVKTTLNLLKAVRLNITPSLVIVLFCGESLSPNLVYEHPVIRTCKRSRRGHVRIRRLIDVRFGSHSRPDNCLFTL
jgi:hypothetical protein